MEIRKIYYTIGEVARLFKIETSTLRFWEKKEGFDMELHSKLFVRGKIVERRYTEKDIILIYFIHYFMYVDFFTINGAKRQLQRIGMLR